MTKEERKEYNKKYREDNKEKLKAREKKRYMENKDNMLADMKIYRENNKEKLIDYNKEYGKLYRENNKDTAKKYRAKWYEKNKETISKINKIYRKNNKEKFKEYQKNRRKKDPLFKLSGNIRNMINNAIRKQNYTKRSKTHDILGCSFVHFKTHIESQWESWMNWDNYGLYNGQPNYGWDIDHIIPISSDKTEEGIVALNHYTNLQPLCSKINRDVKKNKF